MPDTRHPDNRVPGTRPPDTRPLLTPWRYLGLTFLVTILLALAALTLTVSVDPFRIWGFWPDARTIREEGKASLQIRRALLAGWRQPPATLVIGTSHLRRGFSEEAMAEAFGGPALVASINTISLPVMKMLFDQLYREGTTKTVLLETGAFISDTCIVPGNYTLDPGLLPALAIHLDRRAIVLSAQDIALNLGLYTPGGYYTAGGALRTAFPGTGDQPPAPPSQWDTLRKLGQKCQDALIPDKGPVPDRGPDMWLDMLQRARNGGSRVYLLQLPESVAWQEFMQEPANARLQAAHTSRLSRVAALTGTQLCDFSRWLPPPATGHNEAGPDAAYPLFLDWLHFSTRVGLPMLKLVRADSEACHVPLLPGGM